MALNYIWIAFFLIGFIVAVYFGSVGIKNTRHAIGCGLLADLAGFITAIFVAYLFFT